MEKNSGLKKAARNAALVAAAVVGKFGATKDNAPEAFDAGIKIEGYGHQPLLAEQMLRARRKADDKNPQIVGSMRGSEWLRENRRLRSAGLPQTRAAA